MASTAVQAATVFEYDISSNGNVTTSTDITSVLVDDLARGPGLQSANGNGFATRGFNQDNIVEASFAGDFVTFGFESTTAIQLDTLSISLRRNGNGPETVGVGVLLNDFFLFVIETNFGVSTTAQTLQIAMSGFQPILSARFFLVGWNADTSNGKLFLPSGASATLTGDVVPVPVPAGAALLLGGVGLLGLRRRLKTSDV